MDRTIQLDDALPSRCRWYCCRFAVRQARELPIKYGITFPLPFTLLLHVVAMYNTALSWFLEPGCRRRIHAPLTAGSTTLSLHKDLKARAHDFQAAPVLLHVPRVNL